MADHPAEDGAAAAADHGAPGFFAPGSAADDRQQENHQYAYHHYSLHSSSFFSGPFTPHAGLFSKSSSGLAEAALFKQLSCQEHFVLMQKEANRSAAGEQGSLFPSYYGDSGILFFLNNSIEIHIYFLLKYFWRRAA
jgi:hypothetical protein